MHDDVLGPLLWDCEREAWTFSVPHPRAPFRVVLAGGEEPDARLLPHAREILAQPERLLDDVMAVLKDAALEIPEASHEILGLHVESVELPWPDRPEDGIIFLDGPGTDERVWRCDYVGRRPRDLGFDD